MKKQLIIALTVLIPAMSFAKTDFSALIDENSKAQQELHSNMRGQLKESGELTQVKPRERIVVVEKQGISYNAPTKSDLLAFKKEKRAHRASESKRFERLANEIHSLQD